MSTQSRPSLLCPQPSMAPTSLRPKPRSSLQPADSGTAHLSPPHLSCSLSTPPPSAPATPAPSGITLGPILPQGLCTTCSYCLKCFPRSPHSFTLSLWPRFTCPLPQKSFQSPHPYCPRFSLSFSCNQAYDFLGVSTFTSPKPHLEPRDGGHQLAFIIAGSLEPCTRPDLAQVLRAHLLSE